MKIKKITLSLVAVLALAACDKSSDAQKGAGGPPPAEVNVIKVGLSTVDITQDLPGRLQAIRTAEVRARVEGIVEERLFTEGSDVRAGQSLFRIDLRTYKANAEAAAADELAARQVYERNKQLLEIKAVSQQEFEASVSRFKLAQSALAKATLDMESANVAAPISGRIGHELVTVGALVGRNESTPMALIEQMDPMYVNFTQTENDAFDLAQAIKKGVLSKASQLSLELILPDGSLYEKKGKLIFSDQHVDSSTGAVLLRAEFPNPDHALLPGSFVRIRIPQARLDKAIVVPQRAVQMTSSGAYLLVVDEAGKVGMQPVQTGAMSGQDWVITDGLKPDTRVIVDGLQKARPGATVKPVELPKAGD
jgi:membrane fusion protein (multidrug efflux system)